MSFIESLAAVANDPAMRQRIYDHSKDILPHSPRCATVQSLVYYAAKGKPPETITLAQCWPGTDGYRDARLKAGWNKCADMAALKPGYVLFSQDKAGRKGAPDHVYLFMGWLDQPRGVALIYDNNGAALRPRNLGKACWYKCRWLSATPFDYALYTTS